MGRCLIALLFAAAACGPVVGSNDGDTSTTGTSATTTDNPTTATSATSASNTASTTATDPDTTDTCYSHSCLDLGPVTTVDPSDTTSVVDTCGDFVCLPDLIVEPPLCDIWAQDCFEGAKCMPWAEDGDTHWSGTRCSPLDPNPAQPGDPCTARGGPTSGIDNCDVATMCMFVDPDTNQGTCVPFCMGNEDNPLCEDPSTACAIDFDETIVTCLPACDPLLQDCAQGGCYPTPDDLFVCAPTIGIGLGADQTCGHAWECAPGYTCYDGAHVPDCEGDFCCAPFCDITVPGQCEELVCEPWFMQGQGPGQDPPIGVCIIE